RGASQRNELADHALMPRIAGNGVEFATRNAFNGNAELAGERFDLGEPRIAAAVLQPQSSTFTPRAQRGRRRVQSKNLFHGIFRRDQRRRPRALRWPPFFFTGRASAWARLC